MMKYVYMIERAADGSWSAYVPDLPGCTSCGDTLEELKQNILEAVGLYVTWLREHDGPVPESTAQADVVEAA